MTSTGTRTRTRPRPPATEPASTMGRTARNRVRDDLIERAAGTATDEADRRPHPALLPVHPAGGGHRPRAGRPRRHRAHAPASSPRSGCRGGRRCGCSTPTPATDGWSTAGTVVQIVTDDMPYLVESVSAELVRGGPAGPPGRAPDRRGQPGRLPARCGRSCPAPRPTTRRRTSLAESWMSIEVDLITDADRSREIDDRPAAASSTTSARSSRTPPRWPAPPAPLADQLEDQPAGRRGPGPSKAPRCCAGSPTATSPSSATATTSSSSRRRRARALRAVLASGLGVLRQDSLAARSLTAGPGHRPRTRSAPTCSCSPRPARPPRCTARSTRTTSA